MRYRTATLAFVAVVVFLCTTERLNPQTQADWDWTNKKFDSVLDASMPMQKDGGLYVSYRANKDFYTSTPEYWFMIGVERTEKQSGSRPYLTAHVRVAQPVSIYDQLMTIHRENPSIQDTVLEKSVGFQSFDLTEMTCPAIKVQIEKLKSLPVQLPDMNLDYIILHPVIHAFYINGTDGDVRLSLTDSRHTLVRWARQTREALDACGRAR